MPLVESTVLSTTFSSLSLSDYFYAMPRDIYCIMQNTMVAGVDGSRGKIKNKDSEGKINGERKQGRLHQKRGKRLYKFLLVYYSSFLAY